MMMMMMMQWMLCRASSDSALYASITATPSQDQSTTAQQGMSHALCCFGISHFTPVLHSAVLVLHSAVPVSFLLHSTHTSTSHCCSSTSQYSHQYFTVLYQYFTVLY